MIQTLPSAFERRILTLPIAAVLPRKQVSEAIRQTAKYRRIACSVVEIGLVEPLAVSRMPQHADRYLLLDGHMRLAALVDAGIVEARCLVAADDEAFTYNKRINRLATIQEHYMIVSALKNGVPEVKLAQALDVDVKAIRRRRSILDRICPEVVELLKDHSVNPVTFDVLRKMKPLRQIEVAELMCSVANWSSSYAKALLAGTRQEDLARPEKGKKVSGLTSEQMARMEREMASLQQDFKQIEASYGDDMLNLVIAVAYLRKLIGNAAIATYLDRHHAEILQEFQAIIASASLDERSDAAA